MGPGRQASTIEASVFCVQALNAVHGLSGISMDDLRTLTRSDLAQRSNKRIAEIIFAAIDSLEGRSRVSGPRPLVQPLFSLRYTGFLQLEGLNKTRFL